MIGIDTNLLIRLAIQDDDKQFNETATLIEQYKCYVPVTVLLEVVWVLQSHYRQPWQDVSDFLRYLLRLSQLTLEDEVAVEQALNWADHGMDIADALHAARSPTPFASFDKRFVNCANAHGVEVKLPAELTKKQPD